MPHKHYASLCFLSYNRPQFLFEAIRSAVDNAGYPCEVIVHDDGSTSPGLLVQLLDELAGHHVSRLILNPPGHNEGVGTAINRAFKVATGDPIIKLDQDLLFREGWLARVAGILQQDDAVGMLGLFKYPFEPVPWERMRIDVPTKGGYHYTRQFCGSAFAIPRSVWEHLGPLDEHSDAFAEDSAYMERVRTDVFGGAGNGGWELALPDVDLVENRGFGIGPSTVVEEGHVVHKIHHGPFVLGEKLPPPKTEVISLEPAQTHDFEWRKFDVGVVITTCVGREENLSRALGCLSGLKGVRPRHVVIVCDGCTPDITAYHEAYDGSLHAFEIPKHAPGQEQPRNVGFRRLRELDPDCNYVWFLDSDLIVPSDCLESFYRGLCAASEDRVLLAPYDWLPPGVTGFVPELKDAPGGWGPLGMPDYRWASFKEHGPEDVLVHDLGAALGCLGGNLMWPVDRFEEVGGYHPELHHGRCEDGELGLRAGSQGVPMSWVRDARGWHVWHPVDTAAVIAKNARDVPLINKFHPWMPDANDADLLATGLGPEWKGLLVTAADGARFEWKCPECGEQINTLEYWPHSETHRRAQ